MPCGPQPKIWTRKCRNVTNLALGNLREYGIFFERYQNGSSRLLNMFTGSRPPRSYASGVYSPRNLFTSSA